MNFVVSSEALLGVRGSLGTSSVLGDEREVPAAGFTPHFVYPQGLSQGVQTDYPGLA